MKTKFLVILLLFTVLKSYSQVNLNCKIIVQPNIYQIIDILDELEKQCGFSFSYSKEAVDVEKKIYFSANDEKLKECLDKIAKEGDFNYKIISKYVVLLPKQTEKQQKYEIKGKIKTNDNRPLSNATIIELTTNKITQTNDSGEFTISIESDKSINALSVFKEGYQDTILVCSRQLCNSFEAKIKPISHKNQENKYFENFLVTKFLIPTKNLINSINLISVTDTNDFQISLAPFLSTTLVNQGVLYNKISINLTIGYNRGLDGFEYGFLANINKENVNGFQFSNGVNVVGNNLDGFQFAGISNIILGNSNAFQGAGLLNLVFKNANGFQISPCTNIVLESFEGVQISNVNFIYKTLNGLQLGHLNYASAYSKGIQIAGISNVVNGECEVFQIAGVGNINLQKNKSGQIAGLFNYADTSNFQICPVININKYNEGFQLGLLNISDSSKGLSIGLFNYIKNGIHSFKIGIDELLTSKISFNSGNNNFFVIYSIGLDPNISKIVWNYSIGAGNRKSLSKNLNWDKFFTFSQLFYNKFLSHSLNIYKFSTGLEYKICSKIGIFCRISLNYVNQQNTNIENEVKYLISKIPFKLNYFQNEYKTKILWPGIEIGLSI